MMSINTLKNEPNAILPDNFLDYAHSHGFGDLHFKVNSSGMTAIIAIHNTRLGPALGGCRFIEYVDTMSAIYDAMRLARGMSYKAASVNLPLGGGKAVIIKPKHSYNREAYMRDFGKFVNELGGRYITALDSGTQLSDMDIIAEQTPYVASLSTYNGDPSPYTAKGVLIGMQVAVQYKLKKNSLDGLHVAIQGLGHVGYELAKLLFAEGAKLTVSDIDPAVTEQASKEFGATVTSPDLIYKTPCDIFAPCALGAILNDISINQLQTPIIAGAANNQLAHTYHGTLLHEKGILYAPDYVLNAGGLIFAASKYFNTTALQVDQQITAIGTSMKAIFTRSQAENRPTNEIADTIAQEKLDN